MFNAFLALLSPLLLVFGLYHLFTWFNIFRINGRAYWRRVGLTAAISHFLLATGFFLFAWFDHRGIAYLLSRMDYATFVFQHSAFWQMLAILILRQCWELSLFSLMGPAVSSDRLLLVAMGLIYIVGTLQWCYVGGAAGAILQKVWDGLKTGDEGEEWFQ